MSSLLFWFLFGVDFSGFKLVMSTYKRDLFDHFNQVNKMNSNDIVVVVV